MQYPSNPNELKVFILGAVVEKIPPSKKYIPEIKSAIVDLYEFMGGDNFSNPQRSAIEDKPKRSVKSKPETE